MVANSYDKLVDPAVENNVYSLVQYQLTTVPRQVRLETSSFCTMQCGFCHRHSEFAEATATRPKGRMTTELFDRVLDDIASWPEMPGEIVPVNFGELLMNKNWEWMLHRIASKLPKVPIKLVTTGLRLNAQTIEKLAQVPTLIYLNMSLNAFFGETWERVHKVPAKHFPKVVAAVHAFRDRRPDVYVNVSMVHDPEITTELEKDLFLGYWSRYGPVTVSNASYTNNPHHIPKVPVTLSCRSMFDGLVVQDNSDVTVSCCFDGHGELIVGKFGEQTLLEIWHGEKLKVMCALHNAGRRNEIKLCSGCSYA